MHWLSTVLFDKHSNLVRSKEETEWQRKPVMKLDSNSRVVLLQSLYSVLLLTMWLLRQEALFQQRATGAPLMEEKNYFKSSLKG